MHPAVQAFEDWYETQFTAEFYDEAEELEACWGKWWHDAIVSELEKLPADMTYRVLDPERDAASRIDDATPGYSKYLTHLQNHPLSGSIITWSPTNSQFVNTLFVLTPSSGPGLLIGGGDEGSGYPEFYVIPE